MKVSVEINLKKFNPWLKKHQANLFALCFAYPASDSKKKMMIRINNEKYFTLWEIEEEEKDQIFTVIKN